MSRHKQRVEARLAERFGIRDALEASDEQRAINEMFQRVAKIASEDTLREDGFFFCDGQYMGARRFKETPGMVLQVLDGHTGAVRAIGMSADVLLTFGMDGYRPPFETVYVWAPSAPTPVARLPRHALTSGAYRVVGAVSVRGVVMCCAGPAPWRLELIQSSQSTWDLTPVATGAFGHDGAITCCGFSPNGNVFVTGSLDTTCVLWDPMSLQVLQILNAHAGGVATCHFGVNDAYLFTAGALDMSIKRWDVSLYTLGATPSIDAQSSKRHLHSKSSETLCDGPIEPSLPATVRPAPPSTTTESLLLEANDRFAEDAQNSVPRATPFEAATWMQMESRSSVFGFARIVHPTALWSDRQKYNRALDALFSPSTTLETLTLENHIPEFAFNDDWCFHRPPSSLRLPPLHAYEVDAATVDVREDDDDPVKLSAVEHMDILSLLNPTTSARHPHCEVVANTMHSRVASICFEHRRLHAGDGGEYVQHSHTINGLAVSPSGDFVISVASDRAIKRWHAKTGEHEATTRDAHAHPILCCALAAHPYDSSVLFLATGSADASVKLWNAFDMSVLYTLLGHYDSVVSLTFTPSRHALYSSSLDTRVIKWQIVPTVPDAPRPPTIIAAHCHAIEIAWLEPLGNGAPVLQYEIRTSRDDGPFEAPIQVSADVTVRCMDALDPGTVYAFKIAARNHVGLGAFSESSPPVETLAFRPSKVQKPCAIRSVATHSVVLEWLPPQANGTPISHYHFRCIPEDTLGDDDVISVVIPEDAIAGQSRAAKEAAEAAFVRKLEERAERDAERAKRLNSKKALEKSVKLQLQARARLERQRRQEEKAVPTALLKYTLTCVLPGTIYQFQLAAANRCGVADFSIPSMYIKTESCEPNAPDQPTLSHITPTTVQLHWQPPRANGSAVVQYTLEWRQDGDTTSLDVLARTLATPQYTLSPLHPGKDVCARLRASNVIDKKVRTSEWSPWSETVTTLPTTPSAVAQPLLQHPTSHSMHVEFSAPCGNGRPIVAYHATLCAQETAFGVVSHRVVRSYVWHDPKAFNIELIELDAATTHVVRIAAENALGLGDYSVWSMPLRTKTAVVPAPVPEAPTLDEVQPTCARLHWRAPVHNGGSPLVGYVLEYAMDGNECISLRVPRLHLDLRLDFLKPKTNYVFRVAAINSVGTGPFSSESTPLVTPSLVEYTLRVYFANRPDEEHVASRRIQRCYRAASARHAAKQAHAAYLSEWLRSWNLL
ncbi:hypothetical protein SPRG_15258 [Saprolegnia parasitica CBS 223.65]|uniref:Fibronectin type-III domain-containing protein n=1 Tax=Saprolegnia parasitica (strain CBS 223.65) TaxID=695850 RepID=A0A067BMZ5_SAPPC|nr:hypothetical protein SPRG_15258 [Saprolegnia parasitica CBS 223.65]KDO19598.1 hypothetical protein SPRG_15258 [Saprolegnia parasitica CBS 223.65]|eukprot:XP_012209694.1 hypothetical protein SPRG_15258 [Saprolegnia parasitica CBS 223.65]